MKSFVYIVLMVLLGTITVQGYGPKIERKKFHKSPHRPNHKPSHGQHHQPHHHGPPHRPDHRPSHADDDQPWDDNSPIWDRSGSRGRDEDSDSYDSYDHDDRDDRFPSDSYEDEKDSSGSSGPSSSYEDEDYRDWYHHPKRPHPHPTKRPPKPTRKPIPTSPRPQPTTHRPIPTTHRPIPTTHRPIPTTHKTPSWHHPTLPPHPAHTKYTPQTKPTTEAIKTNPTTPCHTRTVRPFPPFTSPGPTTPTWHPTPTEEDTTHWETTTEANSQTTASGGVTTTDAEEEFTTLSPVIEACIQNCLSTPEYNPVCGSNGQTYDNEGKLFCASSCGVKVALRRRSVCPPPLPDYDDGNETPPPRPPPTTTESNMARTTSLTAFDRCMKQCRIIGSFTPVCGSDLVTYMNVDRLKCAQSCGEVVEVICEKPCAACGFGPVTPKTTTTLRPTTTQQFGRSTLEPDIKECTDACPKTTEDNPVCGSNHVTYKNPSHMLCAQLCGEDVIVVRFGRCGTTTSTSTTTEALPSTLSPAVRDCIRRCPVTSEYDPVCGTDGLTYHNLGNLHCSKFCGNDVDLKHKSRCADEFDLGPDGDSTTAQTTKNINGSKDKVTTLSPWRTTDTATSIFTSKTKITTPQPTLPITKPTTKTTSGPSSSTYGFTIPSDILNDIFGPTTPANKPNKQDEDEDIDLDARYSNDTTK